MAKTITYVILAIVFVISLCVAIFGDSELIQKIASIPLVTSLVGAVFQLLREEAARDRALFVIDYQNQFALGASSHMANVAFDKHVQFCEEYVEEAIAGLKTLFRLGPTTEGMTHAGNLNGIREKYAVWITAKIDEALDPFEVAFQKLGSSASYVENTLGKPGALQRQQHIDRMYKLIAEISGEKEWDGKELKQDLAVAEQIRFLRGVLGTEEFSEMRKILVAKAFKEINL